MAAGGTIFPLVPSSLMASPMASPTDTAPPPPPYQMTQAEFDQKTSQAIQLASESSSANRVDEDGWEIYDPAAMEAIAESIDHQPPSSSSAGFPSTDTHEQVRQGRRSCRKVTRRRKVRSPYLPFSGPVFLL